MPKREKPFLTYPELIDKLKSKGMVINDADLVIKDRLKIKLQNNISMARALKILLNCTSLTRH